MFFIVSYRNLPIWLEGWTFTLSGTIKVISAKLSKSGSPLVVLATRHAFLFDMSLMCWLRVADDCFPASNFSSSWNLGSIQSGELAALQVDIRKYLARKPGWSRSVLFFRRSCEALWNWVLICFHDHDIDLIIFDSYCHMIDLEGRKGF